MSKKDKRSPFYWVATVDTGEQTRLLSLEGGVRFPKRDGAIAAALVYLGSALKEQGYDLATAAASALEGAGVFKCPGLEISVVKASAHKR